MNTLQLILLTLSCALCVQSSPREGETGDVHSSGDLPASPSDNTHDASQHGEHGGLRSADVSGLVKDALVSINEYLGALVKQAAWLKDNHDKKEDGGSPTEIVTKMVEDLNVTSNLLKWLKKNLPKEAPVLKKHNRAIGTSVPNGLQICTWNVFRWGPLKFDSATEEAWKKKYGKTKLQMMGEIISEAEIIAIQEFFDSSLDTLNELRDQLNMVSGSKWEYAVSERVGRVSKEQYVFLFRSELASLVQNATYPEPPNVDEFSREPFYVKLNVKKIGVSLKQIVLGTVHTEPTKAVDEMNYLIHAMDWATKTFKTEDVMTLGDYNGDCQYVRKKDWPNVKLFTDPDYLWMIESGVDTASMNSECTFDRCVTKSAVLKAAFVKNSTRTIDFVVRYGIKVEEARQLSDHFPVCMTFK